MTVDLARSVLALAGLAFDDFAAFLDTELAPRGREVEAVGRDRYALGSRYFLGATVDLEETYAWGWEELHRIETEMARVAGRIVPGGSLDDAIARVEAAVPMLMRRGGHPLQADWSHQRLWHQPDAGQRF